MEKIELQKQEKSLRRIKLNLMATPSTVFFTTILFSLRQKFTEDVPTAGVDGENLFINPEFWKGLSTDEKKGLLVHEIMHIALDHITRVGDRDKQIWNIAGDYCINLILKGKGYVLPKGALLDKKYANKTTEQIYKLIYKDEKAKQKNGTNVAGIGDMGSTDIITPKGTKAIKDMQNKITDVIINAATNAKLAGEPGSAPGEVEVQLAKTIKPKLSWSMILRNFMSSFAKDDYSFKRPNRKFPDFYLPSLYSESIANMAIAVDCSGSVSDVEFSFFITEIDKIKEMLRPKKISIISFDTKISNVLTLTPEDDIFKNIKFKGRGGTRISPVLDWAFKHKPELMLIFTDGKFAPMELEGNTPIFWIINDNSKFTSKFGEVIHYDITCD